MTTVNEYTDLAEAYIDKGFLDNHGIPAIVNADALSQIYPGIGGLGAIRLDVPDAMADKAVELLKNRPALQNDNFKKPFDKC